MKTTEKVIDQIKEGGEAVKEVGETIKNEGEKLAFSRVSENLARMGYGARGLIYGVIGFLAIEVALGVSGNLQDQQGALASIGQQPIGKILLGIVLIGLIGYSLWGLIRALFDPLHKGRSLKGIFTRVGYFISAVAYAILILPTYSYIFGGANAAQNGAQGVQLRSIVSTIFLMPLGRLIVGIIGLAFLGTGVYQTYKGVRYKFDKETKMYSLTPKQIKVVKTLGRFGTLARAVVFALAGIFLLFAAYSANSSKAKGVDGVLLVLLQQPYGHFLLGIVAAGLIVFGAYSLVSAFWFKFRR